MKKIFTMALVFFVSFSLLGCSKEGKDNNINKVSLEEESQIVNIVDELEREKIQEMITIFYFNPMVDEDTDFRFFEDENKLSDFAGYYIKEYAKDTANDMSIPFTVEKLFGIETRNDDKMDSKYEQGYGKYLEVKLNPVIEGIYANGEIIIAKAGLYSDNEETNANNKVAGTVTLTLEKKGENYIIIDYLFEKDTLLEK